MFYDYLAFRWRQKSITTICLYRWNVSNELVDYGNVERGRRNTWKRKGELRGNTGNNGSTSIVITLLVNHQCRRWQHWNKNSELSDEQFDGERLDHWKSEKIGLMTFKQASLTQHRDERSADEGRSYLTSDAVICNLLDLREGQTCWTIISAIISDISWHHRPNGLLLLYKGIKMRSKTRKEYARNDTLWTRQQKNKDG